MALTDPIQAAQEAVAEAEAAASAAVAEAEAAVATAEAEAQASAALGDAEAAEAYQLTMAILQDGQVELIPALLELIASAIEEGIATYLAEQAAAVTALQEINAEWKLASQQASATYKSDAASLAQMLAEYESRLAATASRTAK